jgi:hypothetical protein
LFALWLEVWRLPEPLWVDDLPDYAGCRSWIPLQQPLPTARLRRVPAEDRGRAPGSDGE